MIWRYEIKFALWNNELAYFEHWLDSQPYFRRSFPGRIVNSIYFDTPDFSTALDNLSGIADRTKYRLRWYGAEESARSRFEIKVKKGRVGRKVTADIERSASEFRAMSLEERDRFLAGEKSLRGELPVGDPLQSVLWVRYDRDYFERGREIRVTIDRNLVFGELWSESAAYDQRTSSLPQNVIEFKFAPEDKDLAAQVMFDLPFYPVRNSKYMLGLSSFGRSVYI